MNFGTGFLQNTSSTLWRGDSSPAHTPANAFLSQSIQCWRAGGMGSGWWVDGGGSGKTVRSSGPL